MASKWAELRDPIGYPDTEYELCRRTNLTKADITHIMAEYAHEGLYVRAITYAMHIHYDWIYKLDNGYWAFLAQWIKEYVRQWDKRFYELMSQLEGRTDEELALDLADQESILRAGAKALGIDQALLTHIIQNQGEIEQFLAMQRSSLGTLAELKLWELVASGDAATIRWVLKHVKRDLFGDKIPLPADPKEPETTIIEIVSKT